MAQNVRSVKELREARRQVDLAAKEARREVAHQQAQGHNRLHNEELEMQTITAALIAGECAMRGPLTLEQICEASGNLFSPQYFVWHSGACAEERRSKWYRPTPAVEGNFGGQTVSPKRKNITRTFAEIDEYGEVNYNNTIRVTTPKIFYDVR